MYFSHPDAVMLDGGFNKMAKRKFSIETKPNAMLNHQILSEKLILNLL